MFKEKNNKLTSLRVEEKKLLEEYKTILTRIEYLKNYKLNVLPVYDGR